MPRPRIWIPTRYVIEAYEETGSMRAAARRFGVSRSVIERYLAQAGVRIRDREEAMEAVRSQRETCNP